MNIEEEGIIVASALKLTIKSVTENPRFCENPIINKYAIKHSTILTKILIAKAFKKTFGESIASSPLIKEVNTFEKAEKIGLRSVKNGIDESFSKINVILLNFNIKNRMIKLVKNILVPKYAIFSTQSCLK